MTEQTTPEAGAGVSTPLPAGGSAGASAAPVGVAAPVAAPLGAGVPPPMPPIPPVAAPLGSGGHGPGAGRPRRGGASRPWLVGCLGAAAALLVVGLGVAGYGVYQVVSAVGGGSEWLSTPRHTRIREELVKGDAGESSKVVVVDVKGMIVSQGSPYGEAVSEVICQELDAAREDPDVVAVILDMDTPGGEVTASDEIHRAVRQVCDEGKPVVTCMGALGASGGYMVACASDYIIASRLTLTGSVGVIIGTLNYAGLFEKVGLRSDVYKSGAFKDMLNGGRQPTEAERAYVQGLVDETFREFAGMVAEGREAFESEEDVIRSPAGDGRVMTGRQAKAIGLVDELGYFDDAVDKARELAECPEAKVVRYRRPGRLAELLFALEGRAAGGAPGALGALVPAEVRQVRPGRLYYLMPSVLP